MLFTKTLGLKIRLDWVKKNIYVTNVLCSLKLWTISSDHIQESWDEVRAETRCESIWGLFLNWGMGGGKESQTLMILLIHMFILHVVLNPGARGIPFETSQNTPKISMLSSIDSFHQ